jgi:hypothetical protein
MASVTVFVIMVMIVGMGGHPPYSTRRLAAVQPFPALIGQYDTSLLRID